MNYPTPRIVQPGGSRGYLWGLLVLVVALLGLFLAIPYLDQRQSGPVIEELQERITTQQQLIAELETERIALNERIAGLVRSSQIDQEAMRQVRGELSARHEERAKLDEELAFLRSMVSAKDVREGVQIQRFSLKQGGQDRVYRFSFTITQTMKNGDAATGWIFFAVDGVNGEEPAWLPLREITEGNTEKVKMRFKHFQEVEGVIQLPEGFTPLKVIIEIKPSNKKLPELKRRFDWVVEEI